MLFCDLKRALCLPLSEAGDAGPTRSGDARETADRKRNADGGACAHRGAREKRDGIGHAGMRTPRADSRDAYIVMVAVIFVILAQRVASLTQDPFAAALPVRRAAAAKWMLTSVRMTRRKCSIEMCESPGAFAG